jgi:tRNA U38,U39,U40 pseudouridine synthase TruA
LKNMTHKEAIHFILEHIVHRFSTPQILTTDQGSSFMSHQVREFVESLKIKLLVLHHTTLRPMVRMSLVIRP